jgi:hypothetical protein
MLAFITTRRAWLFASDRQQHALIDSETPTRPDSRFSTEAFKQLHETCRHAFGLYVRWFTLASLDPTLQSCGAPQDEIKRTLNKQVSII